MRNPIWAELAPASRAEVDELIRSSRRLYAVKLILEAHPGPKPLLRDAVDAMCERGEELGC
ncbi:hypothetical protein CFP65_1291 [Kitasatospora sp. MMS16-BH015]|uniref:hypothetical protein n=1 Tax=Kitasatospora sp. MMS16-BH015 TaxID=2018025 RepID=UPI000CA0B8F6|nr:hypothetical protein [Kitasatospora sp. MMS16-BH015]AUG76190.1 hypothetical protein CFP65_1291 [Kitasatospora sp. MMS16-BH015]